MQKELKKHIINLIIYGNSAEAMEAFSKFLQNEESRITAKKRREGILICNRFFHVKNDDSFLNINQKEQLRTKVLNDLLNYLENLHASPNCPAA